MALDTPYGVIVGPLHDYDLVNPDTGQWPHYHVRLSANGQVMDSAINLKSLVDVQIEYRRRTFAVNDFRFASIVALGDGIHVLAQSSSSGALDYVRHSGITGATDWTLQNGDNLISELNAMLNPVPSRIYIFGATYSSGVGVHDVHMNQGDPDGSSFQHLDAIWQDGGALFQYAGPQPRLEILQIKFETQSLNTDDNGLPIPFRIPPVYSYIPRWRWPVGDPLTGGERQILVDNGLFQIASWASAIAEVSGEARVALSRELHAQLSRLLKGATAEHVARVADYVVKLGQQVRAGG